MGFWDIFNPINSVGASSEQSREIVDAPDEALVHINIDLTARTSIVTVIEEG
jgi:hypothetical protein